MPVYVKEGSIIPVGPELQYTDEHKPSEITLYVYGGANATFSLYEDEGTNYNYEKGSFSTIQIFYDASTGILSLGDRKGGYEGMLSNRVFNIVYMDAMNARAFNLNETKPNQKIKYDGKKVNLKLAI
jgi:alpha-D-xyloside xylohydrolase